jgi:hypothetical protein
MMHWRGQAEDAQKRLDEEQQKSLAREREITDRMMVVRFGPRAVLTPEQIAAGLGQAEPRRPSGAVDDGAREWQKKQTGRFQQDLNQYIDKVEQGGKAN